jgi:hypothetical protein
LAGNAARPDALLEPRSGARELRLCGKDLRHALECVQHGGVVAAELPADPRDRHQRVTMGEPCCELASAGDGLGQTLPAIRAARFLPVAECEAELVERQYQN